MQGRRSALSPVSGESIRGIALPGVTLRSPRPFSGKPFRLSSYSCARLHFNDPERVKDSSQGVRLRTPGKGIPQILHRGPVTEMNIPLAILQNICYFILVVPRWYGLLRNGNKDKLLTYLVLALSVKTVRSKPESPKFSYQRLNLLETPPRGVSL